MPARPTRGLCVAITTSSHATVCPIDLHRARAVAELVGVGVLVDPAAQCHESLRHTGQIAARMDARLIRETHAWPVNKRHRLHVLGIEPQLARERRIVLQAARRRHRLLVRSGACR